MRVLLGPESHAGRRADIEVPPFLRFPTRAHRPCRKLGEWDDVEETEFERE